MEDWVKDLGDYAKTALRPTDGELQAAGLEGEVEIITDNYGVPHVFASSRNDAYFAQGYLHATERLFQVDLTRRVAQGRLAELLGEPVLPLDRFFRTIGLGRSAKEGAPKMDQTSRRVGEAYHRGFTFGVSSQPKPVEYQILALEPDFPEDFEEAAETTFAIGLLMAFNLSPNWEFELIRMWLAQAVGPERARQLAPFVSTVAPGEIPATPDVGGLVKTLTDIAAEAGKVPGIGSNNWVVSGDKTTTGKPILANDPHLKISMPGIWTEMHLSCPDMNVTGVSLPGVAGIIIGHNDRIAWGFTNTGSDIVDLYVERLSDDRSQYEYEGEWHPTTKVTEEIVVRHAEEPVPHEVTITRHGPLLDSFLEGTINPVVREDVITEALAFRWIHHDVPISQESIEEINLASDFQGFRAAASKWPSAGQNMVFADVEGNIGYQYTGTVPARSKPNPGAPVPGWNSEHEWNGTIPFDELPTTFNPESGFIATANNRVVGLDYPHYLTNDWEPPYRIDRITQMLSTKDRFTIDDIGAMQYDTYSGIAAEILPILKEVKTNGEAKLAFEVLEGWDLQMSVDSSAASLFVIWITKVAEELFAGKVGAETYSHWFTNRSWTLLWAYESVRDILKNPESYWLGGDDTIAARDGLVEKTLRSAMADLTERFGVDPSGWAWGKLHTIWFRHPLAGAMPPLDELLSVGPFGAPGADDTVNRGVFNPEENYQSSGIASYRQIIDLSDFDHSRSIITSGTSGNPASPHYSDQSEKWVAGSYHPMLFSRGAIEAAAEGTLKLLP
jgi:penicillin amidase